MDIGKRIVFIGDSITEWGRYEDQEGIGTGYVRLLHDYLRVIAPEKKHEIFNRGVGGDRIINLKERWEQDVIDLAPDVVSVSIGINDVWRQLDQPEIEQVSPEAFEATYRHLLEQVKSCQLVLMEPTVIEEDENAKGNQLLKKYVEVVQSLANEYKAVLVPTHEAFVRYLEKNSGYPLTTDGVHMNSAGNTLMAKTWIEAVE
ncbi:Lysophospholipase L1 [Gracilibacillus orientalis]|uniref:Lysophospholipase L1 n=1 Tax=Gracilibacillus orientalis TaxID=334253 RepID=A0A1I4IGC4_9BACI|nr:SGNH/GDSL hydrolase family protein [Gracilibacillus orientalis]SFL53439.1 Lysophospholipase L1 [Gracilibacillus orientalis]